MVDKHHIANIALVQTVHTNNGNFKLLSDIFYYYYESERGIDGNSVEGSCTPML